MAGQQCCDNPPTLSPGAGVGHVEQIGGLSSYVCGPPDSKLAVIFVPDVFGYEAPKLRSFADKVGAAGYYTVVPDFFHGNAYDTKEPIMEWIKGHGPDQGFEAAKPVIETLKSKGVTKIGALGFCWGAKVVVELAKYAYIQAGVLLHPSFVTTEDIQAVKVPISVLGAEIDQMSPPELVKKFEDILNANPEVDGFVKIFKGMTHGWSCRYKDEDASEIRSAEEAHKDALEWLHKHIK
ncbi:endo-1,3;1,4-beta-D-glucanase-like [Andrographis paniculata]|uniref:endo-1,3;1,4-beta-D-glucanase-like n=1 Tax=Andrographis paniculata TaxID=175694 RepID=UPI0021E75602|nr:endo-1,3;1,4-beta-D-glucanase-like [Andrographis paniculata]